MPLRFDPKLGERFSLLGTTYVMQPHPRAPLLRYSQEGRQAKVYQLRSDRDELWALKVFKKAFQKEELVASCRYLKPFEGVSGLSSARREVVLPQHLQSSQSPDLKYAILMRWMAGSVWAEWMHDRPRISKREALGLCEAFLRVVQGLEERGCAHTDISSGNVMVDRRGGAMDVQLLDLESLYAADAPKPNVKGVGSDGYRHRASPPVWCAEGDRYAAAVLAAEMLILPNARLAGEFTENGFFVSDGSTSEGAAQYARAEPWLRRIAPQFSLTFARSWTAPTLADCPSVAELFHAVGLDREAADSAAARRARTGLAAVVAILLCLGIAAVLRVSAGQKAPGGERSSIAAPPTPAQIADPSPEQTQASLAPTPTLSPPVSALPGSAAPRRERTRGNALVQNMHLRQGRLHGTTPELACTLTLKVASLKDRRCTCALYFFLESGQALPAGPTNPFQWKGKLAAVQSKLIVADPEAWEVELTIPEEAFALGPGTHRLKAQAYIYDLESEGVVGASDARAFTIPH